jgi:hypothetical protein
VSHRCTSAKRGTIIYGRCWCKGHYFFRTFGEDSDLRRRGQQLAAQEGKNTLRNGRGAVAGRLAVLLHRLWVSGEVNEPLHKTQKAMSVEA